MREKKTQPKSWADKLDDAIAVVAPAIAVKRKQYRMAYDVIDKSDRLNKKRSRLGGTADKHLDEHSLFAIREICRDLCLNNPLVKGLLKTERDGVVGNGVKMQARTTDIKWNAAAELLWKEEMQQSTVDVTGRFNIDQYLRMMYLTYRRDGDMATIFTSDGLQAIEGEQIGTPFGTKDGKHYTITNGIAFSKKTNKVVGYYIGKPADNGFYIQADSVKKYLASDVHHHFTPERFSQSRGEPALTSAIKYIDYLCGYVEAELVAAKVNACFALFITEKDAASQIGAGFTGGVSSTGKDADDNRLEKVEPGMIYHGEKGEDVKGIGMERPGAMFDPFVRRMLMFIGRPLLMPLMLVTLDFSDSTFMNTRIAYQKVQEAWMAEQDFVLKPFISRLYKLKIDEWISNGQLSDVNDKYKHDIACNRWPYVDPYKEARADMQQLENGTTTRTAIIARQGGDFSDIMDKRAEEDKAIVKKNIVLVPEKKGA